jgi:membrane protein
MSIEGRIRALAARHKLGRALVLLFDNLDHHQAPTAAGAMAFDAFLSLVPLVAIAGYVLHQLRTNYELVFGPIVATAPEAVQRLVESEFLRLSDAGAAVVAPVSAAAFLWVSSAGISTAMSVFEQMFHSPSRPWYVRRAIAMGAVIVGFVLLLVVISAAIFLAGVSGSLGAQIIALVVPAIVVVGLISAFFRIAIRKRPDGKRRVLPGAIVTIFLWTATSAVFSFYVSALSRYATLYGSLAAVAIFMFWLWLLALSLLVGGEVNAQLEGIRDAAPASLRAEWTFDPELRGAPPPAPPAVEPSRDDDDDDEAPRGARAPKPSHAGT